MKNDLWYKGNGYWVAYSEDNGIITEFINSVEMSLSAIYYHYRKRGVRAAHFTFHQGRELDRGKCLLSYVCSRLHLDFVAAVELCRKDDYTPYSNKYSQSAYQLELFPEGRPRLPAKKRRKNKTT